jgi:tRNA A-37 threonylcarbamoyl transferase component Bud32
LVELGDGRNAVVKDFAPRRRWVREVLGRWLTRREAKAYRLLEGSPGVPRLFGVLDPLALVIEYRPGVRMTRDLAGKLPLEFMPELRDAVGAMHARGVVHLDLRHRSNVLADPQGHPVLIDFASAIFFKPGGLLSKTLAPMLARIDWGAVRKWQVRVEAKASAGPARPGSETEA